jgi:hypothetical protein
VSLESREAVVEAHPVESRAITPQGKGCVEARVVGITSPGEDGVVSALG